MTRPRWSLYRCIVGWPSINTYLLMCKSACSSPSAPPRDTWNGRSRVSVGSILCSYGKKFILKSPPSLREPVLIAVFAGCEFNLLKTTCESDADCVGATTCLPSGLCGPFGSGDVGATELDGGTPLPGTCDGRCGEAAENGTCNCTPSCVEAGTCCVDYTDFCLVPECTPTPGISEEWTCDDELWCNGACDCGCGVVDPDCGSGGLAAEQCDGPAKCGDAAVLDMSDLTQCICKEELAPLSNDPNNCGGCGFDCEGGECHQGVCIQTLEVNSATEAILVMSNDVYTVAENSLSVYDDYGATLLNPEEQDSGLWAYRYSFGASSELLSYPPSDITSLVKSSRPSGGDFLNFVRKDLGGGETVFISHRRGSAETPYSAVVPDDALASLDANLRRPRTMHLAEHDDVGFIFYIDDAGQVRKTPESAPFSTSELATNGDGAATSLFPDHTKMLATFGAERNIRVAGYGDNTFSDQAIDCPLAGKTILDSSFDQHNGYEICFATQVDGGKDSVVCCPLDPSKSSKVVDLDGDASLIERTYVRLYYTESLVDSTVLYAVGRYGDDTQTWHEKRALFESAPGTEIVDIAVEDRSGHADRAWILLQKDDGTRELRVAQWPRE